MFLLINYFPGNFTVIIIVIIIISIQISRFLITPMTNQSIYV